MKISRMIGTVAISLVLALPLPGVAYAEPEGVSSAAADDSDVSALIVELVERNPGTSFVEMEQAVKDAALATGASATEVAREALSEAGDPPGFVQIQPRSGSKPKANQKIGTARNRGDVFYTPSSTAGVNHGHSGIYSYTTKIVEADTSTGVVERWYTSVKVASGAHKQYVSTSQANRDKAADRARTYRGRSYNYNFAFNKTANGSMNCSQVVWAAYKTATGIDLDSDGGHGVYPSDIRDSKYTVSYQRF
ncbi:hypothetical protein [Trueperella abortisuis]|uniref:hypothetical protein n=1 Tax=Trueperella abortisuis TaxID=445930 RepID=UPI0028936177|nr:hypothetical protein [Trueperella abortisuis]